ncbi:MAG TPA: hypothetical protein ENI46_03015, partial [Firmicutes bacterium]|nr:hypothetical protein [Bacillota bacterium]
MLIDETVYDIEACSAFLKTEGLPPSNLEILKAGKVDVLRNLEDRIRSERERQVEFPLRCWASLGEVRICPPIRNPSKIICLGRNYRDHAEEQGAKIPEAPLLFAKAPTAVIGPGDAIVIPRGSSKVDFEGEFAVVIARTIRNADE